MVIRYLDLLSSLISSDEAHAELVVDPDAVLRMTMVCESLQPVPRR